MPTAFASSFPRSHEPSTGGCGLRPRTRAASAGVKLPNHEREQFPVVRRHPRKVLPNSRTSAFVAGAVAIWARNPSARCSTEASRRRAPR